MPIEVNDVHSRLNATKMAECVTVTTAEEVVAAIGRVRSAGRSLIAAGGRHAMGGQQFLEGGVLLDARGLDDVLEFDADRGHLRMGAGAMWPAVIAAIRAADPEGLWSIRQKQTGADDMTLGGAVGSNVHGRGIGMAPFVEDVERLTIACADGRLLSSSRTDHPDLFRLVIGGYGLFGVVTDVTLRLTPRRKLRRIVDIIDIDDAIHAAHRRFEEGCLYGDFQYAIEPSDEGFLRRGVLACYKPVDDGASPDAGGGDLTREDWLRLLQLAHTDKRRAFQLYSEHYLRSHGRVYWSDTMQLSTYIPSYADFLAEALGRSGVEESLMITELYVPPDELPRFMEAARRVLRDAGVENIYGTIRTIRADEETFLPWAREDFACIIFNLRTTHTPGGLAKTRKAARHLIDAAADLGGSFFLTYHSWATRVQVERCHPLFRAFLDEKLARDPDELFQSNWYRHYRDLFGVHPS